MAVSVIEQTKIPTKSGTIPSSSWTASNATFSAGSYRTVGNICNIALNLKLTSAVTAGTEVDLGTLSSSDDFFINSVAVGVHVWGTLTAQNTGLIRLGSSKNIANGSNIYLKIICTKD